MSRIQCFSGFLMIFIFILSACSKDDDDATLTPIGTVDCTTVTYSGVISALATSSCNSASCHGTGSSNGDLTTYAGMKVFADNDKLKEEVLDTQDMPRGGSLTSEQLGQFKCWLDAGAPNN